MLRLAFLIGLLLSASAQAETRGVLGWGRLLHNDGLGDIQDRWHTGAGVISRVTGKPWTGVLPSQPGELIELRFSGEIIAPSNLRSPAVNDRPFATQLSLSAHTHFSYGGFDFSVGAGGIATGPQTGLFDLQTALHDLVGVPGPGANDPRIGNGYYGTIIAEASRDFELSERMSFRPFAQVQRGVETLARVGGDFHIGAVGRGDLFLRDSLTGQRYRVTKESDDGWAAIIGGDITYVRDSVLLPTGMGYDLLDTRTRFRAGVHWQRDESSLFYGVTYMSKEFSTQIEGQLVGSIRLDLNF